MRNLWQRLEDQGVPTLASRTHGRHHRVTRAAALIDSAAGRLWPPDTLP